jgi:uncharacterized membrane protein YfcA
MQEPYAVVLISVVSLVSTYFGTLISGGGLLVTPVLLSFGLPVPVALGTRRFSTLGGLSPSLVQFHRWKKIDYKFSLYLAAFSIIGSVAGYHFVDVVNEFILKKIIGFFIVALAIALFFENTGKVGKFKGKLYQYKNIIGPPLVALSTYLPIIIGGGGGTVFSYVLIIVYSQTILQSAGNRKLPLLVGQILTTILFVRAGYVHYPLAFAMLVANMLKGWFGARFFLKKGGKK